MKNYTKVITGVSLASILSISAISALDSAPAVIKNTGEQVVPIGINEEVTTPYYSPFTGIVKEIAKDEFTGNQMILVEREGGMEGYLVISDNTYFVNDNELKVGSTVTGFYKTDAPMLMIYPGRYDARVLAVDYKEKMLTVDQFNDDLISRDGSLVIKIGDKTEIITEDGKAFEGSLKNRKLVAEYNIVAESYPAQATPERIVVLEEEEEPEVIVEIPNVEEAAIVVADKEIPGLHGYVGNTGEIMVPLRGIAEALGYEVKWEAETQRIFLGVQISLEIGKDAYNYMRVAPIQLGTAPELVDGKTYVPLQFFKEVARMNNAYFFEGQIVIDNNAVME